MPGPEWQFMPVPQGVGSAVGFAVDTGATPPHKTARGNLRPAGFSRCFSTGWGECPEWQRGRTVNPLAMPS